MGRLYTHPTHLPPTRNHRVVHPYIKLHFRRNEIESMELFPEFPSIHSLLQTEWLCTAGPTNYINFDSLDNFQSVFLVMTYSES